MLKKRKDKKSRKYRGNRTQGYGIHKKHRGGGSKGGRGYGGSKKHKKIGILKYEPEHFNRRGFTPLRNKQGKKRVNINIDELLEMSSVKQGREINLSEMGIHKLLGKGNLKKLENLKGISVIVDKASSKAIEKVEKSGGKVILRKNKKIQTGETTEHGNKMEKQSENKSKKKTK